MSFPPDPPFRPTEPGLQGGAWPPSGLVRRSAPVRAPSGSHYHEQGRNGQGNRLAWLGELFPVLVVIAMGVLGVSLAGAAMAAVLDAAPPAERSDDQIFADPLADLSVQLAALAVGVPAVLWGARYLGNRPSGTVSSVVGRLRWGWLCRCAAVAFPLMALQIGLLVAWTWDAEPAASGAPEAAFPGWPALVLSLAVLWALVPFQVAAEEYVFRGWLVQLIGRTVRSPWPGIMVTSLLFALAHGLGELSGFVLLFYSAMWWGWLVKRTGGLEAVIALHVANNALAFALAAALGELANNETAADAPWQALVLELVFAPLYCLVVARIAARRSVDRQTP
ncbi:CPBP family intramembrane metalloprotease [Streptomyces parvus]|uniref:CPBP family intramembrane metalloprotease n=1 Tax=Streptomyces parvus TaxID=66428 RepID=A0A7K3SCL2_9ACTN|nr:CPBP family intramembrane metalloprotease [Streptomyces parvus]